MSDSKLCKVCGCVIYDQTRDLCDACSKDVDAKLLDKPSTHSNLDVNTDSSQALNTLNTIMKAIAIILLVAGGIMMLVGLDDLDYHPTMFVCGFSIAFSSITIFIIRPVLVGLQKITEASEYIKADIKKRYDIKD